MKLLHLSFHKGCINSFQYICGKLSINVENMYFFNENIQGKQTHNEYYVMTKEKALYFWKKYRDYFEGFDAIITSDTAPLSRIFLENGWDKPLYIWICNRFDYAIEGDQEYYKLFRSLNSRDNVKVFGYTSFEVEYCLLRNVVIENVINPCGGVSDEYSKCVLKPELNNVFYIPCYHNDTKMMDLASHLALMGIPVIGNEKYNGPLDLLNYKGVIHIPYAWSNLSFFEMLHLGIVYFIPSKRFLIELSKSRNFFWSPPYIPQLLSVSEWYNPFYDSVVVKFDSWDMLREKITNLDYDKHRIYVKEFGKKYEDLTLHKWKNIIDSGTYLSF